MRHIGRVILLALCLPFAVTATAAADSAATPLAQAHSQLDAGDPIGALRTLDGILSGSPGDPQARFLRGLTLVKLNRSVEAIDAFHSLTHDYPKLPEPYNNLAVLYAQKGDLILARDTLESCLVEQPDYAPAHENLGDVYAALAAKSYSHALALNPADSGVRYKLSVVSQIGNGKTATAAH